MPASLLALALGTGYALWSVATQRHSTNSSVLLIVLGVLTFLIGLVSEQIATSRVEPKGQERDGPPSQVTLGGTGARAARWSEAGCPPFAPCPVRAGPWPAPLSTTARRASV